MNIPCIELPLPISEGAPPGSYPYCSGGTVSEPCLSRKMEDKYFGTSAYPAIFLPDESKLISYASLLYIQREVRYPYFCRLSNCQALLGQVGNLCF